MPGGKAKLKVKCSIDFEELLFFRLRCTQHRLTTIVICPFKSEPTMNQWVVCSKETSIQEVRLTRLHDSWLLSDFLECSKLS